MDTKLKKELTDLKDYCINYIKKQHGESNNYIKKTRITKNGLFIYGHKVYAPRYSLVYDIFTFINFYDSTNYDHINNLLDMFVLDCKRLKVYE